MKKPNGSKKLMKVIMIASVFTIIVGAITGGWFGIEFDKLPPVLQSLKYVRNKLIITEPLKQPLVLFIATLSLGVIQVLTGVIIKFILLLRERKFYEAFTAQFSLLLVIIGFILWGFNFEPIHF